MLPNFQSADVPFQLMQSSWAKQLNPVIANPLMSGQVLKSVHLTTGANEVNHKLQRPLQGWFVTRIRSAASLYDTQDANQMPNLTLSLQSSADVIVDLYVF